MSRGNIGTATAVRASRDLSDGQLVAAARRGDDAAFEQLYERYLAPIAGYVQRMVKDHGRAEDITQEVFVSALRRMRDTERPIAFKPWVYEIARNACIDQYRRSRRGEEVSYDATDGLPGSDHVRLVTSDATPDDAFDAKQRLNHLCGAFGGLSKTHHQILVQREFEGLSYREIGERLGMSRAAVESTLFRARKRLTEEYDDLVTGRRCARVHAIIAEAAEGMLGVRDRRRLARHLSYCQPCRRHARLLGVDSVPARSGIAGKLAALLPLPAFLRRRDLGQADPGARAPAGVPASSTLAHWSASASAAAEPLAGWAKATLAVAAVTVAGAGAGVTAHNGAISELTSGGGSRGHHAPVRHTPHQAAAPRAATRGSVRRGPARGSAGAQRVPAPRRGAPGARGGAAAGDRGGSTSSPVPRGDLPGVVGKAVSSAPSVPGVHVPSVPPVGPVPDTGGLPKPPPVNVEVPAPRVPPLPSAPSVPSVPSAAKSVVHSVLG